MLFFKTKLQYIDKKGSEQHSIAIGAWVWKKIHR